MLACSFDEVGKRIAERGTHTAAFSTEADARRISDAFREAVYADEQKESYLGIPLKHFTAMIRAGRLDWAPDGDEAFDDGSYVLQFDVGSRVRLIAFTSTRDCRYDSDTLRDVWLAADDFYAVLQQWYDAFHAEWESVPKSDDSAGPTVLHG